MAVKTLTYRGRTQTVSQWARELGIKPSLINARLRKGMSIEQALTPGLLYGKGEEMGRRARLANTPWRNNLRFRGSK